MNPRHLLLVVSLLALLLPTARKASATPPDIRIKPMAEVAAVVEMQLLKPLAEKEARRSRFTRASLPPRVRQVRVLDRERSMDGRGAEFAAFAVDERSGWLGRQAADDSSAWHKDAIVGCVYPARGEIFIRRGDKFFEASLLLGKKTIAADETVCRPVLRRPLARQVDVRGLREPSNLRRTAARGAAASHIVSAGARQDHRTTQPHA